MSEPKWTHLNPSEHKWIQSKLKWTWVNPTVLNCTWVNLSAPKWPQVNPSEPKWIRSQTKTKPSDPKSTILNQRYPKLNSGEPEWTQSEPELSGVNLKGTLVIPSEPKQTQVNTVEHKGAWVNITDFQCSSRSEIDQQLFLKLSVWAYCS